jgi:hypothetical protein
MLPKGSHVGIVSDYHRHRWVWRLTLRSLCIRIVLDLW